MAVGLSGMADLQKAFKDLASLAERNKTIALKLIGEECKTDVQAKITEIGLYKSGDYRRSVHVEPVDSSKVLVGTNRVDGRQHEYGGVIKAKNKPYLVFKIDGHWVRVKQVYQPPHPHFRPVFDANWQKYQKMYLEALGRV